MIRRHRIWISILETIFWDYTYAYMYTPNFDTKAVYFLDLYLYFLENTRYFTITKVCNRAYLHTSKIETQIL